MGLITALCGAYLIRREAGNALKGRPQLRPVPAPDTVWFIGCLAILGFLGRIVPLQ